MVTMIRCTLVLFGFMLAVGAVGLLMWLKWGPGIDMTPERRLVEHFPLYTLAGGMLVLSAVSLTASKVS